VKDLEDIAKGLDWRSFEELVFNLLSSFGFQVKKNLVIKKPRREIDLIAEKEKYLLAVDCKSWKRRIYSSRFYKVVEAQIDRSKILSKIYKNKEVYPVILSIYEIELKIIKGVPIVPISKLKGFLMEFDGYKDQLISFKSS